MSKIYFTLTGTKHYFGNEFLKKGTKIRLEKEPDNEYDKEAIKVTYEGLGKIGYVANSSYTVIGDSMSAGRIYDKSERRQKQKWCLSQSTEQSAASARRAFWIIKRRLRNLKQKLKNKEI